MITQDAVDRVKEVGLMAVNGLRSIALMAKQRDGKGEDLSMVDGPMAGDVVARQAELHAGIIEAFCLDLVESLESEIKK